ncbi:MAG: hypothetical protein AAB558_03670 [Patescibacteria group bacterium]
MKNQHILLSFLAVSGLVLASISAPVRADGNLVDDQTISVATNLGLFGGTAEDIATDPNSDAVYFASMSPSGIFSSIDLGDTWTGLPSDTNYGTGKAVEVDPDTGAVFALIGDSLLRSEDQGTHWEDKTANVIEPAFKDDMVFGQSRLLIALNGGSVGVSDDGGDTFEKSTVDSSMEITSLASAGAGGVFYAVTSDGESETLYQSTDGGETWTDMDVSAHGVASGGRFNEISVDPDSDAHLVLISIIGEYPNHQSFDTGDTWSTLTDEDGDAVGGAHATFDGTGRLYVGSQYTDNPAASPMVWEQLATGTPNSSIYADAFDTDEEDFNILYTNSSYGVARSEDRGLSWEDVVSGVTAVKVMDVSQATDKDIVWIGANGGLAKTENFTDNSPTWEYPILPTGGSSNIRAVWVKPDDADTVVMGGSTFFYYTTDGGDTWNQSEAVGFSGGVQDIIQSRLDDNTVYAVFYDDDLSAEDTGGVYMSEDAGQTWTDLELPDNLPAISLAVAADDTLYVGIGGDAATTGIYQYAGGAWALLSESPQTPQITSLLAHPSDASLLYATTENDSTGGAFYTSTDAGVTWNRQDTGIENINHLDTLTWQNSSSNIYLSGQDGSNLNGVVYKSTDSGNSWSLFYTGLKQESFYTMLFDGLLLGNDRGLYGIQSKAKLKFTVSDSTLSAGETLTLNMRLRDAATGDPLENKKLKVFKKVGKNGEWVLLETVRTNAKGKAKLELSPAKKTRYKVRWVPKKAAAEEYTTATSVIRKVTLD